MTVTHTLAVREGQRQRARDRPNERDAYLNIHKQRLGLHLNLNNYIPNYKQRI